MTELDTLKSADECLNEWGIESLNQRKFLAAFILTGNVTAAARACGLSRMTHYAWMGTDGDYREIFQGPARVMAGAFLEDEAIRRATEGVTEQVGWYQGKSGGLVQKYSDTLLIFLLKGAMPDKYRERQEIKHDVAEGSVLMVPVVKAEDWPEMAEKQQAELAQKEGREE